MSACKDFVSWVCQVTVLLILLLFLLWLCLRPTEPSYNLVSLTLSNATNGKKAPSSASFVIRIYNSNRRAAIKHAATNVALWLGKSHLGGATLGPFWQSPRRTLLWEGTVELGRPRPAVPGKFAGVEVVVTTKLRYRVFSWRTRPYGRVLLRMVPRGGVPANPEGLWLRPTHREWWFSNF